MNSRLHLHHSALCPSSSHFLSSHQSLTSDNSGSTVFRTLFHFTYPLSLVFSHSSKKCRGVPSFFPFWNSARPPSLRENLQVLPKPSTEHPTRMRVLSERGEPKDLSRRPLTSASSLECALTGKHRVSPGFGRNCPPTTPLECALTETSSANPLECALTKKGGGAFSLPFFAILSGQRDQSLKGCQI